MQHRFYLTCSLLIILTACVPATTNPSPLPTLTPVVPVTTRPTVTLLEYATSSPTSEIISPTLEASPTLAVTLISEATITETIPPLPTLAITLTPGPTIPPLPTLNLLPTPAATGLPQPKVGSAAIQFLTPGPLSKLLSPVKVYAYAIPGFGNKGSIFLYGEDGRLMASEVYQLIAAYPWAYFNWTLPFEIQGAGELARLTMSTQDQYGRLTAVNSLHLILLSEGYSIINPPGDLNERCVIEQPRPGLRIAGGMLRVAGEMRPFNSLPLVVELIAWDGNVISSQLVTISPASDGGYLPFQVDLTYSISTGSWVRLVVRQPDDRIAGTMYLYSREVFLNP